MNSSEEPVLDLRMTKLSSALPCPVALPPFSFCFSPSRISSPEDNISSPLPTLLSPTLAMTQRVLSAAYTRAGKPTRPFKAYPKNPLSMSTAVSESNDHSSNRAYLEFRQKMFLQVSTAASKRPSSPASGTSASGGEQEDCRDAHYWERRRKNNEAAKRSRDARRLKEDEIAIRAAFLEQENLKLKYELATLRNELTRLRCLVCSR